ncbi:MAG: zinc ribbon domain-containing protein [Ruminococcaceae bacterium]|nr:zinc ribbon domain-containing protein [Oscillospiraceae bacterium]
MDAFDKTVQKAKDVFDIAINKTGEFVNVSKLKISVSSLNNKLEKAYARLGKIQFKALKDANIENVEIASTVAEIKHIRSEIKTLLDQIDELEGKSTCPKCGCKVPAKSAFCNNCGERF